MAIVSPFRDRRYKRTHEERFWAKKPTAREAGMAAAAQTFS
jgi:hypothetical protein